MSHAATKAHHADSQLVGSLVGSPDRVTLGQCGCGDSGAGALQETAAIEGAVFHKLWFVRVGLNLGQACHSHLHLAKRFGLMFGIDLPVESQNTHLSNRP